MWQQSLLHCLAWTSSWQASKQTSNSVWQALVRGDLNSLVLWPRINSNETFSLYQLEPKKQTKHILEGGREGGKGDFSNPKLSHLDQQRGKNACWVSPSWSLNLLKEASTWQRSVATQGLKGCSTAWERFLKDLGGCKTYKFPHQGNVYHK